jgi:hypothetical protein
MNTGLDDNKAVWLMNDVIVRSLTIPGYRQGRVLNLQRLMLEGGKFITLFLTIIASEDRRYSRSNVEW